MDALLAQHQSRLDAVNAAQQAELDALAAAIAQRNFQRSLEDLARQHEDRLRSIRQSGIESAEAAENRRFRDVMARLNEEQQARLAALRARYGKEEDSDSKKEDLEAEHKRRMMGLYTESAREQERKRYEEALKELEYQEEEADLLEQFQEEKADAEETHQDELERIRQEAIQRQIDEENERYAAAVADAQTSAGGVGKKVQAIEGWRTWVLGRAIDIRLSPTLLPPGFDGLRAVFIGTGIGVGFHTISPLF